MSASEDNTRKRRKSKLYHYLYRERQIARKYRETSTEDDPEKTPQVVPAAA